MIVTKSCCIKYIRTLGAQGKVCSRPRDEKKGANPRCHLRQGRVHWAPLPRVVTQVQAVGIVWETCQATAHLLPIRGLRTLHKGRPALLLSSLRTHPHGSAKSVTDGISNGQKASGESPGPLSSCDQLGRKSPWNGDRCPGGLYTVLLVHRK